MMILPETAKKEHDRKCRAMFAQYVNFSSAQNGPGLGAIVLDYVRSSPIFSV
jgi:hypothetical protein